MSAAALLLDELVAYVRRYVVLAQAAADVVALWTVHTHAFDAWSTTPYLSITSAEKESGKTRLLEVLELVVASPWLTGRTSTAALVRKIETRHPTLLLDETDANFNGEKEYAEALRGILNSGYRRSGRTTICVGPQHEPRDFSTFCPKAFAGIGDRLPDTVVSRSLAIPMKRRAPGESVEWFFQDEATAVAEPLRVEVASWASEHLARLEVARPELPSGLRDRTLECARPLFAIADLAGGDWPDRARTAVRELACGDTHDDDSIRVRLLADVQRAFDELGDRLATTVLLDFLHLDEESPWGEWYGKPLTGRALARLLKPHEIRPRTVYLSDGGTAKGYQREQFEDAWARYLPPKTSGPSGPAFHAGLRPFADPSGPGGPDGYESGAKPHGSSDLTDLTDRNGQNGDRALSAADEAELDRLIAKHRDIAGKGSGGKAAS